MMARRSREGLYGLDKDELYDMAQWLNIEGRSKMDKSELVEAIEKEGRFGRRSSSAEAEAETTEVETSESSSSSENEKLIQKAIDTLDVTRYNGHERTCKGSIDSSVDCRCHEYGKLLEELKAAKNK